MQEALPADKSTLTDLKNTQELLLSTDFYERTKGAQNLKAILKQKDNEELDVASLMDFLGPHLGDENFGVVSEISQAVEIVLNKTGPRIILFVNNFVKMIRTGLKDARRSVRLIAIGLCVQFSVITNSYALFQDFLDRFEGFNSTEQTCIMEFTQQTIEKLPPSDVNLPEIAKLLERASVVDSVGIKKIALAILRELEYQHPQFRHLVPDAALREIYADDVKSPIRLRPLLTPRIDTNHGLNSTVVFAPKAPSTPRFFKMTGSFGNARHNRPRLSKTAGFFPPLPKPQIQTPQPYTISPFSLTNTKVARTCSPESDEDFKVPDGYELGHDFSSFSVVSSMTLSNEDLSDRGLKASDSLSSTRDTSDTVENEVVLLKQPVAEPVSLADSIVPNIIIDDPRVKPFRSDFGPPTQITPRRRPPRRILRHSQPASPEKYSQLKTRQKNKIKELTITSSPSVTGFKPGKPKASKILETITCGLASDDWTLQNNAIQLIGETIETNPDIIKNNLRSLVFDMIPCAVSIRTALSKNALEVMESLSLQYPSDFTFFFEHVFNSLFSLLLSSKNFIVSQAKKTMTTIVKGISRKKALEFLMLDHKKKPAQVRALIASMIEELCEFSEDRSQILAVIESYAEDATPEAREHARRARAKLLPF